MQVTNVGTSRNVRCVNTYVNVCVQFKAHFSSQPNETKIYGCSDRHEAERKADYKSVARNSSLILIQNPVRTAQ